MSRLGALVVSIEANLSRFTSDMRLAAEQSEAAMGRVQSAGSLVVKALGLIGVGLSIDALVGMANKSIDALADLDDMAQKTGSSVENLSKLSKVAAMTGVDFGSVDAALVKLAKNMATVDEKGSKFKKALDAIGMSTKDIARQDPSKVFVDIARKLQDYQDGAGKTALVTDAISKSAADLMPFMNDVSENFDTFTGSTKEAAAAATKYQDDLGRMRVKYDELATSIVSDALPAANDFIGALGDLIKGSNGVNGVDVAGWADDAAVGMARVVDVAVLLPSLFSTIAGSFRVVAADIQFLGAVAENMNPVNAAIKLAKGGSPNEDIKKAAAERNAILAAANVKWDDLWNKPANKMEQAILARIAARGTGGASGDWGRDDKPKPVNYSGGEDEPPVRKPKPDGAQAAADALLARLREQAEAYGLTGAALLSYQLTIAKMPDAYKQQALALQTTVDGLKEEEEAEKKRAVAQQKMADEAARVTQQNNADVEQIRQGLLSDVAHEQEGHQLRLDALHMFHDARLENIVEANLLIEEENARHERVKADMQMQHNQQAVGMAGDSSAQMYSLLQSAGMEQTALGKVLFFANKAIAVAEIIMSTEVAAAKALTMGPIIGPPLSFAIRAMGYASAGIVIGTAIASAEGGYDIPAGKNPLTQLHEKEMVLPKAQADVIRGLASNGGKAGGDMKVTIVNQTTGRIDNVVEQRISPTERALIIQESIAASAAQLSDPNSKTSRAMSRNFNVPRTR